MFSDYAADVFEIEIRRELVGAFEICQTTKDMIVE